ncbi:MAG: ATP phosphoribosyltransferase regulatory subunit [Hyphomicrobiaceae bacterium]
MTGNLDRHSARWLDARAARETTILQVFDGAGFERVSPPFIQPAALLVDLVGEEMRERTFGVSDRTAEELCLRTDLTVPICRLFLERHPEAQAIAKYASSGMVFRQPTGAEASDLEAGELHQVGLEIFNSRDPARAEVEVLDLVMSALRRSDLRSVRLRIGDVGVFHDLVDAIDMPPRWRERLKHHFRRPKAFMSYLRRLTSRRPAKLTDELRALLDPADAVKSEQALARHLDARGVNVVGSRSLAEVTAQLLEQLADETEPPLELSAASIIDTYLSIEAPPQEALKRIAELGSRQPGLDLSRSLNAFEKRLALFAEARIDTADMVFAADFGRDFEYYTGFVFEVTPPGAANGRAIAGGGRYDRLLQAVGAPVRVPAAGAAIYTDRLLAAAWGGGL